MVAHVGVGVPRAVGNDRPPPTGKVTIKGEEVLRRARMIDVSVALTNEEDSVEPLDIVLGFVEGSGLGRGVQLYPVADKKLFAWPLGLLEPRLVSELEACVRSRRGLGEVHFVICGEQHGEGVFAVLRGECGDLIGA